MVHHSIGGQDARLSRSKFPSPMIWTSRGLELTTNPMTSTSPDLPLCQFFLHRYVKEDIFVLLRPVDLVDLIQSCAEILAMRVPCCAYLST
ncbi:hypothetical protein TNCV_232541 [Trichonephila clavipes]|nr:hypothetical protein TNCV_232541 [Trichonephila clavipes]